MPRLNNKHLRIQENGRRNSDYKQSLCSDALPQSQEYRMPARSRPLEGSKILSVYRQERPAKSRCAPQDPRPLPVEPEMRPPPTLSAIPPSSNTAALLCPRTAP